MTWERIKLLISKGWIQIIDVIFMLIVLATWGIGMFDWIFSPSFGVKQILVIGGVTLITVLLWLIVLAYRAIFFLLIIDNNLGNVVVEAARRAAQFISTGGMGKSE